MLINKENLFYQTDETPAAVDFYTKTPKEIDEELAKMDFGEDEVEPELETETPAETETEEVSKDTDTPTEPEAQVPEEKAPENKAPETDTAKTDTDEPLIDDELIAKYPEDYRTILEKYKGQPVITALAKALTNANKLIGKRESLMPDLKKDEVVGKATEQPTRPQVFPTTATQEDVVSIKNSIVLDRINRQRKQLGLSEDFELPPNMDINSKEYREWYKDAALDFPLDLDVFKTAIKQESASLESAYNELNKLRSTWKQENDRIIDQELLIIEEQFKKAGVNLADYGVNLNDEGLLKSLIFSDAEKMTFDDNLVDWINNEIPLLRPGALSSKYLRVKGGDVLKQIVEGVKKTAKAEGAEETKNNRKPVNKGLGATSVAGQEKPDANFVKDPYKMNTTDLDAHLKKLSEQFQD